MSALLGQRVRHLSVLPIGHGLHRPPHSPKLILRALSTEPSTTASSSNAVAATVSSAPKVVQYLGYGGAFPFVVGGLGALVLPDGHALAVATQLYGSAILSFLGGVHWGLALRTPSTTDFIYSVTPSLVGWAAALAPPQQGLAVLSGGFVAAWAWDEARFRGAANVPLWYRRLRRPLTVAAAGGCALAWRAVQGRKMEEKVSIREADAVVVSTSAYESAKGDVDVQEGSD